MTPSQQLQRTFASCTSALVMSRLCKHRAYAMLQQKVDPLCTLSVGCACLACTRILQTQASSECLVNAVVFVFEVCACSASTHVLQTQASSERFVDEVEKRWGVKFPEGRNPDLTFMAHLWEPLRSVHVIIFIMSALMPVDCLMNGLIDRYQQQTCTA